MNLVLRRRITEANWLGDFGVEMNWGEIGLLPISKSGRIGSVVRYKLCF